jgi:hypothetical protein
MQHMGLEKSLLRPSLRALLPTRIFPQHYIGYELPFPLLLTGVSSHHDTGHHERYHLYDLYICELNLSATTALAKLVYPCIILIIDFA